MKVHSTPRDNPMRTPHATPPKQTITMPMISGGKVDAYALAKLPSTIISTNAKNVAENDGKARLIGIRPAISQIPNTIQNEISCHSQTFPNNNEPHDLSRLATMLVLGAATVL